MSGVLGSKDVREDVAELGRGVEHSVMERYVPPFLGAETRLLMDRTSDDGWLAIAETGRIVRVLNGAVRAAPMHESGVDGLKAECSKGQPICVFGLGLGHAVAVARSITNAPILVYEPSPDEVVSVLRARITMPGVHIACTRNDLVMMLRGFLQFRPAVTMISTPDYTGQHEAEFAWWTQALQDAACAEQITINTIGIRMPEWIANLLGNLKRCVGKIPALAKVGQLKDVPAFIVAAGPSLGKNEHLLAQCKKKGVLITVDVCAGVFSRLGLVPDAYVLVEGRNMAGHIEGNPWVCTVPKLYSLQAGVGGWDVSGDENIYPWCDSNHAFTEFAERVLRTEGMPIGGSVTTACALFAEAWGCNPIVMVGQDLANSVAGVPYAEGVRQDLQWRLDDGSEVLAWGGKGVVTSALQWDHARSWFVQRAISLRAKAPDVRLINATEGGSHIEGWSDIPLADVLSGLPERESRGIELGGGRPITRDDIDEWLSMERERVAKIVPLAKDFLDATETVIIELKALDAAGKAGSKGDAEEALKQRAVTELAYREAANLSTLFVGYTQKDLFELNRVRKIQEGEHAVAEVIGVLETEISAVRGMADAAVTLAEMLNRHDR